MNQPLTKTEIIKTYNHPMDALTGGRYMDSQEVTNRHSEIEQDERDVQTIRNTKKWVLRFCYLILLPVAVVIVFSLLGDAGL